MSDNDKTKIASDTETSKNSMINIWTKYTVLCGRVYDFFAALLRGQRTHTPETLKVSQKRGTWIVSLFIAFAVIGAFMDEDDVAAETDGDVLDSEISVAESEEIVNEASKSAEKESPSTPIFSEAKPVQSKASVPYRPTRFVYVCSDCGTVVVGQSQPRSTKCPAGRNSHHWDTIGSHGDTSYQCGKCGAAIQMKATPSPGRCPHGSGHRWERL